MDVKDIAFLVTDLMEALTIDLDGAKFRRPKQIKPKKKHVKALLKLIRAELDYIEDKFYKDYELTTYQISLLVKILDYMTTIIRNDGLYKAEGRIEDEL